MSSSPKLLLINSNDKNAFAALRTESGLIISYANEFIDEANHLNKKPDKLINCIYKISKENNLNNIDAIAVTIGPGSFTGIRVGISIAKGLAFGLNKKIIPVNNFQISLNKLHKKLMDAKYCTLIPAKLPEYYYSVIINDETCKSGCVEIENLGKIIEKDTIIVGDFDDETSIKHSYFEYINVKNLKNEPDSMLELAENSLEYALSSEDIEPLYLKDFVVKNKIRN